MKLLTAVMLVALVATAEAASAAQQGASHANPIELEGDNSLSVIRPRVATSAVGDTAVVWWQIPQLGGLFPRRAYLGLYKPDGSARGAQSLYEQRDDDPFMSEPDVGIDDAGVTTIVWSRSYRSGANEIVYARYSKAGRKLGELSLDAERGSLGNVRIAVASNGQSVIVWSYAQQTDGDGNVQTPARVSAVRIDSKGAAIGKPLLVAAAGPSSTQPNVAISNSGNAIVTWVNNGTALARSVSNDGSVGAVTRIGEDVSRSSVDVATDDDGNFTAVWTAESPPRIVRRRFDGAGNALERETTIYTGDSFSPAIAMDNDGDAVITWLIPMDGAFLSRSFGRQGEPIEPQPTFRFVGDFSYVEEPQVAVDADGDPTFAWQQTFRTDDDNGDRRGFIQAATGNEDVGLKISLSDDQTESAARSKATYTLIVENMHPVSTLGIGQANGVIVNLNLPSDHQLMAVLAEGWACKGSRCSLRSLLPAGSERQLNFEVTRPSSACSDIEASASVESRQYDSDASDDTAVDATLVASPGTIEFERASQSIIEAVRQPIIVNRSGGCLGDVRMSIGVTAQTAERDSDFTVGETEITIRQDFPLIGLPISIVNDDIPEDLESFTVTLESASGAEIGDKRTVLVEILDDDERDPDGGGGALPISTSVVMFAVICLRHRWLPRAEAPLDLVRLANG